MGFSLNGTEPYDSATCDYAVVLLLYNTANRTNVDQEFVQEIVPNMHLAFLKFTLPKENDESGSSQR